MTLPVVPNAKTPLAVILTNPTTGATDQFASVMTSLTGVNHGNVYPFGAQYVATAGSVQLSDPFDLSTIDTVYRWNSPVLAGAGSASQATASLTLATGTGASAAAALSSIEGFEPIGSGYMAVGSPVAFEAAVSTNTHRFVGVGTPNASFTAATPLKDAIGWEIDITGALNAVIYANTVRTIIKTMAVPTDGAPHIYGVYLRADVAYFLFDNTEEAVAAGPYPQNTTSNLPARFHVINHTAGPAVAPTFKSFGIAVVDLSANYTSLFNGQTLQRKRSPGKIINLSTVSVAAEVTIWTPAAGRKFRLLGYNLTSGTVGGNITLKDNTGGATALIIPFGSAGQSEQQPPDFGNGYLSLVAGNVLTATGAATQTLSGFLIGCEE